MRVCDLHTNQCRPIEFPEPAYVSYPYANRVFDTGKFRYGYQSFVTPQSVFEYDMASGASTLLKQKEVPGGDDRTRYQVERIQATASDGVNSLHLIARPVVPAGHLLLLQECGSAEIGRAHV